MANFKRRRPRTNVRGRHHDARSAPPSYNWMAHWPRWWDIVFHTRPRRRRTRVAEIKVMQGLDPDAILWPVEKRPHVY